MAGDQLRLLPHLLETSSGLLERLYTLRDGLSPVHQKASAVFLSTFHQACTLLEALHRPCS